MNAQALNISHSLCLLAGCLILVGCNPAADKKAPSKDSSKNTRVETAEPPVEEVAATPEPAAGEPAKPDASKPEEKTARPGLPYLADVPLIPRQKLFGNPDKSSARLSPDGKKIAYVAPVAGVMNVWVADRDNIAVAKPVTKEKERGVPAYFWAYTNQHILYVQDTKGDEDWHVFAADINTGDVKDLTPLPKVNAQIQGVSHRVPDEMLIGLNDRVAELHDLYRVNIRTGERKLVEQNKQGFSGYLVDDDLTVRFAELSTPDGGKQLLKPDGAGGWTDFLKIPQADTATTSAAGFDKTGQILYFIDSRERDTGALTAIDLKTGKQTTLAENAKSDVDSVMSHPTENTIEAVAFNYTRKEWQVLDPSIQPDLDYLHTVQRGEIEVPSRTLDDKLWIVAYLSDNGPVRYYLYDRAAKNTKFLFDNRPELAGLPLVKMQDVIVKARDGLELVCYLSLPKGTDPEDDGVPSEPLPMVLNVHGGPWARDEWGFDAEHQLWANRGYAVLSVNFRGSTGLGKNFVNAGNKEWAGKMHTDLLDAVEWATTKKIADPKRIAITGGSYGGYATLVGLTFTPDVFACGIDIVGPSHIVSLLQTIPAYWQTEMQMFKDRVGDFSTEEGKKFLNERSPLTYVEKIKKPLLIAQGANDPRVKKSEADQIVEAMRTHKIPVIYALYTDEGHGFARPENRLSMQAISEAFLAEYLGGRAEPIGDSFKGSNITVPVGVDEIPGLRAALSK
ncbi:MAG TPA: S9 family peptidase [Pirellulales bacterium]|jgi:dipeptidyl aminopeptidase/acylaminoacyl peptidase